MAGDVRGDVRSKSELRAAVARARPDVVFHLAAQALVRRGLEKPVETFDVNVSGTAKVLDARARARAEPRAVVVVTSDKCYRNDGSGHAVPRGRPARRRRSRTPPRRPAQEHVAAAYPRARAAARDRPRRQRDRRRRLGAGPARRRLHARGAVAANRSSVRAPDAVRPWQHVLVPARRLPAVAERLLRRRAAATAWNFGPEDAAPGRLGRASSVADRWPGGLGRAPRQPDAATRRGAAAAARRDPRPRASSAGRRSGTWRPRSTPPSPGTAPTATARTCARRRSRQIAAYRGG